jgi:hypothetical protein
LFKGRAAILADSQNGDIIVLSIVYQICHVWIHSLIILLPPPSSHSWNSFSRYHFFHLHTCVHGIYTISALLYLFSTSSLLPLAG